MTALLLAEPEASMRGFLERQLSSDGFDVLAFSSTDELPRAADADVGVLGDPAALDRCYVLGCPVIVLGSADAETRLRALAHCDDYLSRPFVYEEVVARIRSHLQNQILSEQKQALVDQLSKANAAKNRFLGMAAHDLRNPLASIRGLSEFVPYCHLFPLHP